MPESAVTARSVATKEVEALIFTVRGVSVMLDSDLAALYAVETRSLLRAMRRHASRFPEDFAFQLTAEEADTLRSQFGISKSRGGRRYLPYVFTEEGVAMLSSVLNSARAIAVNIEIMRSFVRMRRMLASHADLARRLDDLESKYDEQFGAVFNAIRQLMAAPAAPVRRIGFASPKEAAS